MIETCTDRSWNMKYLCHHELQLLRFSCFRNPTNLVRWITLNNKVSKEGLEIILSILAHSLASLESFSPVWPRERNDSHLNYCTILRQQWPYLLISLKYSLFFLPFLLFLYYHRLSDIVHEFYIVIASFAEFSMVQNTGFLLLCHT